MNVAGSILRAKNRGADHYHPCRVKVLAPSIVVRLRGYGNGETMGVCSGRLIACEQIRAAEHRVKWRELSPTGFFAEHIPSGVSPNRWLDTIARQPMALGRVDDLARSWPWSTK